MEPSKFIRSSYFKAFVLITGLGLTLWSLLFSIDKQKLKAQASLQNELDHLKAEINDEIVFSTEVLYNISYLFDTFENIGPKEFQKFTSDLSNRKKGILLIEWQPKVLGKERERFVKKVRSLGVEDFQLLEPDQSGKLVKASKRDVHFPVLYALSTRGEETTTGLDLAWSPERMQSKYEARDLAKPLASNSFKVKLTSEDADEKFGFAITLPVYKTQTVPESIFERREQLKGFLAAVIYLNNLLSPIHEKALEKGVYLEIIDLANSSVLLQSNLKDEVALELSDVLDVYGQKWKINIYTTNAYLNDYFNINDYILPFLLLIFFLLLIGILYISENKNLELAKVKSSLEKALEDSKAAAKSKMTFLANMSHEIRTPLNAILGYTNIIDKENDINLFKTYSKRMHNNGKLLLSIINDILEISSLDDDKVRFEEKAFDLHELIEDVKDITDKKNNKRLEINYYYTKSHPLFLADANRIKQVIINLMNNALKFTNEGKIDFYCNVKASDNEDNYILEFIINDTGIGMEQNYIKIATEAFTQEDASYSRKKGGVGLGLYICKNIVLKMQGDFNIFSNKNAGTSVKFSIPVTRAKVSTQSNKVDTSLEYSKFETKRILIAEDDIDTQFIVKTYLQEIGIDYEIVSNGHELLDKYSKDSFDLILTDIQMPGLDGLSVVKILKDQGITIPILVMSAHTLEEEKSVYFAAGVSDFIPKPLDKSQFLNTIVKHLT